MHRAFVSFPRLMATALLLLGGLPRNLTAAAPDRSLPGGGERESTPNASTAATLATDGVNGYTLLRPELSEADLRSRIRKASPGETFVIPPGASWVLKGTIDVPERVTILGGNPGSSKDPTFVKGFDGPMMRIHSWVTLDGIVLEGSKKEFKGDGIVAGGGKKDKGVREVILTRVRERNCEGNGYVMAVPHYYSQFNFCTFDQNGGYAVVYGEVRSHHTDNYWMNCHYGWNDKGGVAFFGVETDSIWENCEWFHNGGPAFDHYAIRKKTGAGQEIGERDDAGAYVLSIRSCIFRECAGPVWLQRGGQSQAITFEDCRLKHNGDPAESDRTKALGKTVEELFDLTPPVAGAFHVESGSLCVELRGGYAYDNGPFLFTASPKSDEGSRILISGSSQMGFKGSISNPKGIATILDRSLLQADAKIDVKSGIALDPTTGTTINLGKAAK